MTRVLIGAPVRQRAWVLPTWLAAIDEQRRKGLTVDVCCFYEPGEEDDGTYDVLRENGVTVLLDDRLHSPRSAEDITKHRWGKIAMYEHMATMRNRIAAYAERNGYDYLFSLDTDIILQGPREVPVNTAEGEHLGIVRKPSRIPNALGEPELMTTIERLLYGLEPKTIVGPLVNMNRLPFHVSWNYMTWVTEESAPRDADGQPLWAARSENLCMNSGRHEVDLVFAALLIPALDGHYPRWVAFPQGEDVGFPANARRMGLSILVDTDIVLRHIMTPRVLDPVP